MKIYDKDTDNIVADSGFIIENLSRALLAHEKENTSLHISFNVEVNVFLILSSSSIYNIDFSLSSILFIKFSIILKVYYKKVLIKS